jgi:hypothetical protein
MPDPRPDRSGPDDLPRRQRRRQHYLSRPLAAYQRRHEVSDLDLAAELHCDPSALTLLRLCRAPRPGWKFAGDVAEVCVRFGCDAAALRRILEGMGTLS